MSIIINCPLIPSHPYVIPRLTRDLAIASTQGDRESANAVISDIKIKKFVDKATPYIFMAMCCGRNLGLVF
ncbi:MAG: type VI secretion system tube protein Hcp [Cellvibrionaceae bacterium]|nr:type VI secretion system tube protein Hcp [Cellvibrionaceae bacterium]